MALNRTYGTLGLVKSPRSKPYWQLSDVAPHVCIKLKALFERIPKTATSPFIISHTPENCLNLLWFIQRYPLAASAKSMGALRRGKAAYIKQANNTEAILMPAYKPQAAALKNGMQARSYQLVGRDLILHRKRILIGDELGLGKTLTAILPTLEQSLRPVLVVVQPHMPRHWAKQAEKFTHLKVCHIKGRTVYSLPSADLYIISYTCLAGWVDLAQTAFFKTIIFDEIQELRRPQSQKYEAAQKFSHAANYVVGLSATPIYNYGDEIYHIMEIIKPGALGDYYDFLREWCGSSYSNKIKDPEALGAYLREQFLFFKRSRKEVGRELPPINTIVQPVGYDADEVKKSESLARELALRITEGAFTERGMAARELDMLARQTTGLSKARIVAQFVKYLLEAGEPVVLAGWHRDVYDIWLEELKGFMPAMYTGSESPAQKEKAKQDFIEGYTNLFIISLRSGVGLDGLQYRCKTVVFGELDWSPQVHNQVIGRVDRDGQPHEVTAYYLVSDTGSDPPMVNVLGLKSAQAHSIINPFSTPAPQHSDKSRIKLLVQQYLGNKAKAPTPTL